MVVVREDLDRSVSVVPRRVSNLSLQLKGREGIRVKTTKPSRSSKGGRL